MLKFILYIPYEFFFKYTMGWVICTYIDLIFKDKLKYHYVFPKFGLNSVDRYRCHVTQNKLIEFCIVVKMLILMDLNMLAEIF